jgi:plasmid stability protein
MSQLLLTDLEDATISTLEERAARHGRTPQDEAKAILAEALTPRKEFSWERVNAIYKEIAQRGIQPDCVDLLREDRER